MNERPECFVHEMRESGLLYETDPTPSSYRLEVSRYNDYEPSLSLEPNFMIDRPLTSLEEVIDPPLTSLPLVAPCLSSTPRGTTKGVLSLFFPPFPLP